MRRCGKRTATSESLLTALDDCLDAMLSGAAGTAEGQRAHPEAGRELAPLLAVARELIRSRERIDERLGTAGDSAASVP
jgi:hypothetical protein